MARDLRRYDDDVVRVTTAATSRREDIARRQRRYLLSMSLRTICFVGAVIVGSGWLMWVLIAGALVLPYVAVVMANAVASRDDGFRLVDRGLGLGQLESGHPGRDLH
ncbi:DUF3099 domain-containing protein [Nocardioides sp.]|uniref:DUF3099 domain-containing protein n=1 Tax=Nocardioides sp. TaxID=35761 RepID=UPI0035666F77